MYQDGWTKVGQQFFYLEPTTGLNKCRIPPKERFGELSRTFLGSGPGNMPISLIRYGREHLGLQVTID